MSDKKVFSRIRLVQAINHLPEVKHPAPADISVGRVWGFRDSSEAPLIIQLDNGIHFCCEMTEIQKRSQFAKACIGMKVAFYHRGFDSYGHPIKPAFKTLLPRDEVAL